MSKNALYLYTSFNFTVLYATKYNALYLQMNLGFSAKKITFHYFGIYLSNFSSCVNQMAVDSSTSDPD